MAICCPKCGYEDNIFGKGGAKKMASEYSIDELGALPINIDLRPSIDCGNPIVIENINSKISQAYRYEADQLLQDLDTIKDFSRKFLNIVVEDS